MFEVLRGTVVPPAPTCNEIVLPEKVNVSWVAVPLIFFVTTKVESEFGVEVDGVVIDAALSKPVKAQSIFLNKKFASSSIITLLLIASVLWII